MNWSPRIARIAGINVKVHVSFLLILVLGALQWGSPYGALGALFGVLLMLLLFACVTLHELGHSIVAVRFGIPVREIILLPLGGVSLLERNPKRPLHELLVAAAGPLVNLVLAVLLLALTGATNALSGLDGQGLVAGLTQPSASSLVVWLLAANVNLFLFNLIPAFPLDGGRIFRALLAMLFGQGRATTVAVSIGQSIAIGMGVTGVLVGNIVLILVAVFIFFGASQSNDGADAHTVLSTWRAGDAYNRYVVTLEPNDHLSRVVGYILTSYQPDFAVILGGKLLGVVTRRDVLRALTSEESDSYVAGIMRRDVLRVDAGKSLDEVREAMIRANTRIAAVFSGESYLGLISMDDVAEAFAVLESVKRGKLEMGGLLRRRPQAGT